MCVWLSLLTHDSEGPSDKPEQLGDFVKKLITLLSGLLGRVMETVGIDCGLKGESHENFQVFFNTILVTCFNVLKKTH